MRKLRRRGGIEYVRVSRYKSIHSKQDLLDIYNRMSVQVLAGKGREKTHMGGERSA